jgi:hypothetical protein
MVNIEYLSMPPDVNYHFVYRYIGLTWKAVDIYFEQRLPDGDEEEVGHVSLLVFCLLLDLVLISLQRTFRVEGLDRIRDLIDPYVIMDFCWEGRRPYGVYFQWVPDSVLEEGYPVGGSRFVHLKCTGFNWLRDDCFANFHVLNQRRRSRTQM